MTTELKSWQSKITGYLSEIDQLIGMRESIETMYMTHMLKDLFYPSRTEEVDYEQAISTKLPENIQKMFQIHRKISKTIETCQQDNNSNAHPNHNEDNDEDLQTIFEAFLASLS